MAEIDAIAEQGIITPVTPYWVPLLKHDRAARLDFALRLHRVGPAGFRLAIRNRPYLAAAADSVDQQSGQTWETNLFKTGQK